jgi:STE24 endopeptidase
VTPGRVARLAAFVLLGIAWCVAAWLLWQSEVPGSLHLPELDPRDYFSARELDEAVAFERVSRLFWVGAVAVELAVFVLFARRGARLMRESAAGPIGTGMLLGMLGFALLWLAELPFDVLGLWWARRHDLVHTSYFEAIFGGWLELAGTFLFLCLALVIVMGLARLVGDRWWLPAVPAFAALALLFAFLLPYLVPTERLTDPELRAAVTELEQRQQVGSIPVVVQRVKSETSLPNAETMGIGPSRRVVLWDTLVEGEFTNPEVRVVIGHELAHVARNHIVKSLGWFVLFAFPAAYVVARVTRRRGGMAQPEAVPLALLTIVVIGLVLTPFQNVVVRHLEAEADWLAFEATRDPDSASSLFERFVPTALADPDPPTWDYVLLQNHPTIMQRLAMVEAWRDYASP